LRQIRKRFPNAYKAWESAEERLLDEMFRNGCTIDEICASLGRGSGGIKARLEKLGLDVSKQSRFAPQKSEDLSNASPVRRCSPR